MSKKENLIRTLRTLKDSFLQYTKASRKNGSLILCHTDISVYGVVIMGGVSQ